MANHLKMAEVQAILALRRRGWSCRRIARELGIHRETVARYLALDATGGSAEDGEQSKPANLPAGSGQSKPANLPAGSSGPPSRCASFREVIVEGLDRGLTAQRIWQDLRCDHGFEGSYDCVKRFVRNLRRKTPLPFRRMECEPGQEAQVDFGAGAPVERPDGRRRRTHVFRIVLSFSRKGYSEAVYRQTTDDFIRCLENAFWHFGGVPKTLVIDNLKAAIVQVDWFDAELNPKMQSFCQHYGLAVLPTRPRMPRHKGKTEKGIEYVKSNALKGRCFAGLAQENAHLLDWELSVADTRIHGTTRRQVGKLFEQVERAALLPLPPQRFEFFHEARRVVHRDGHVEIARAYYSVPPEYLARTVWVRWDGRQVRVFNNQMQQIALHIQREPGCFSSLRQHIAPEKISCVEYGAVALLEKVSRIGPYASLWSKVVLVERGVQGIRVLLGLNSLAKRYRSRQIEQACRIAHSHGAYRLRVIRQLLKRDGAGEEQLDFIEQHPIIRSLGDYGEIVRSAFERAPAGAEE